MPLWAHTPLCKSYFFLDGHEGKLMWTNIVKFGTMSHGMCSPLGTPIRESAPLKVPKKAQNSENDYIKVFPLLI